MNIKKYLHSIQSYLIRSMIIFYFQWLILFSSLLFISSIFFESKFYLHVNVKIALLFLFFSSFLIFTFISIFQIIQIKRNKLKKYQLETIAKTIGGLSFKNTPDTIINAYQLESNLKNNESNDLANVYIKKY